MATRIKRVRKVDDIRQTRGGAGRARAAQKLRQRAEAHIRERFESKEIKKQAEVYNEQQGWKGAHSKAYRQMIADGDFRISTWKSMSKAEQDKVAEELIRTANGVTRTIEKAGVERMSAAYQNLKDSGDSTVLSITGKSEADKQKELDRAIDLLTSETRNVPVARDRYKKFIEAWGEGIDAATLKYNQGQHQFKKDYRKFYKAEREKMTNVYYRVVRELKKSGGEVDYDKVADIVVAEFLNNSALSEDDLFEIVVAKARSNTGFSGTTAEQVGKVV